MTLPHLTIVANPPPTFPTSHPRMGRYPYPRNLHARSQRTPVEGMHANFLDNILSLDQESGPNGRVKKVPPTNMTRPPPKPLPIRRFRDANLNRRHIMAFEQDHISELVFECGPIQYGALEPTNCLPPPNYATCPPPSSWLYSPNPPPPKGGG